MAWYDTGSISLVSGSVNVAGVGTSWTAGNVIAGDTLVLPDGRSFEVAALVNGTSLTLARAYVGAGVSGSDYAVQPSSLSARLVTLIERQGGIVSDFEGYAAHGDREDNPHVVTRAQVGINQGVSTGDTPSFDGFTSTGDAEVSGELTLNKPTQAGLFLSPGDTGHTLLFARLADSTFGIYDDEHNRTWFRHIGSAIATSQSLDLLEGGGEFRVGDVPDSFPANNTSGAGFAMSTDGRCGFINQNSPVNVGRHTTTGNAVQFYYSSQFAGSISVTGSATSFNTSSDYRLKENITPIQNGADIVMAMQPCSFTAISDGLWYDGFLAHELQEVHPRAVQGTKDAMIDEACEVEAAVYEYVVTKGERRSDGTYDPDQTDTKLVTEAVMGTRSVPDMQLVDYSKLTPILTAALQEALTKIAALESRVSSLE